MTALSSQLRDLIIETAEETAGVGTLEETTKWGQPSFAPKVPKTGSPIRLQNNNDGTSSLMFICTTNLVEGFRAQYGDQLNLIGNREIRVTKLNGGTTPALKHCVAQALTYHLSKRAAKT
ncbi:MAG: DUF1801 domain-containing protein [Pseudomonadota bacterium]